MINVFFLIKNDTFHKQMRFHPQLPHYILLVELKAVKLIFLPVDTTGFMWHCEQSIVNNEVQEILNKYQEPLQ